MEHQKFLDQVIEKIRHDEQVIGLAAAGSYIDKTMDEYSDLDLVLVTSHKIAPDSSKMMVYAEKFGKLINAFTGEHVGERRLLICLYDEPLLHVDIKFLTTDEFFDRVEDPVVVWERDDILSGILKNSTFSFPYPDYQWIEDRFWTWIHYASLKMGRGELFEALDFTSFLRTQVISSLLQIKNGQLPKAMRKVEFNFSDEDLAALKSTIAAYDKASVVNSIEKLVALYQALRKELFTDDIIHRKQAEVRSLAYFDEIKKRG